MLSEYQFQLIKEWVDHHLPDKYLIRVLLGLVALVVLIPGIFQQGPPKWLGDGRHPVDYVTTQTAPSDSNPALADPAKVAAQATAEGAPTQDDITAPESRYSDNGQGDSIDPDAGATDAQEALPFPVGQTNLTQNAPKVERPAVRARDAAPKDTPKAQTEIAEIQQYFGEPPAVSRIFVKTIPAGHKDLVGARQKDQFITTVLPLILAANEEIIQRRNAITRAVSNGDLNALKKWARLYRLSDDDATIAELQALLLQRTDEIPVPIALAQAVVESGWGTSRFARQGNALFGQWAWDKSAGLRPLQASNSRAVVRSFPNLFGSVRAYMHNLNTHGRYQKFREQREQIADSSNAEKADRLVEYLDGYAETGYDYVVKLRAIMRTNQFIKFADAYLQ